MSYIVFAWIATLIYGLETVIVKLTGKYAVKNPYLFNILWSIISLIFMIPLYITHPISIPTTWTSLLIASSLSAMSYVLFVLCTFRLDVSVLSPLYNVKTGLTVLFAYLLLGETMTPFQAFLIFVILLMGFLVTVDEKTTFASFFRKDILMAMGFMVVLSIYVVYLKKTIQDIGFWDATIWVSLLTLVLMLPTFPKFAKDIKTLTFKQLIPVIVVSLTSTIAYVISNRAYEGNVSVTTVIMSFPSSMVIAFFLALIWPSLMERHSMKVYAMRFGATAVMLLCALQLS